MSDDDAIDRVMNPARNPYRLDILNVSYQSPLMRSLHHATYVFEKRLSHTADSQDQRHRMVPASRPLMTFTDTTRPDYVTPRLIAANPAAKAVYDAAMAEAWTAKNRLLALGVPLEFALYVLPNAKTLRFIESGSLLALLHKWTLRTCFNAQEEIYLASMDEVEQVRSAHPRLGRHIGPPCVIRNGLVSPRCTEGSHFCGVPVWRDFPAAVRRLCTHTSRCPPGRRRPDTRNMDSRVNHPVAAWLAHLYTASGAVLAFLAVTSRRRRQLPHRFLLACAANRCRCHRRHAGEASSGGGPPAVVQRREAGRHHRLPDVCVSSGPHRVAGSGRARAPLALPVPRRCCCRALSASTARTPKPPTISSPGSLLTGTSSFSI